MICGYGSKAFIGINSSYLSRPGILDIGREADTVGRIPIDLSVRSVAVLAVSTANSGWD